jgi:hypothetical protein
MGWVGNQQRIAWVSSNTPLICYKDKYIVEEITVIAPAVDRTRNPDHKGRDVWVTGVLSTVVASITP